MPLPRWLARFNRVATNRIALAIPRRFSPFLILHHVGRTSGTHYEVPLAGFRTDGTTLIPPTYGPDADWVKNVLAAGGCTIDRRGSLGRYSNPRLVERREAGPQLPRLVRPAMRVLRVTWFLAVDQTD
jgi:deazaflavin-dependent oxidoreductase (nitroreductase family)